MTERPWLTPGEGQARHAPAAARNRDPILAVLEEELPGSGLVLEVASGSGEHALAFAQRFPALTWQPSDADPRAIASIGAWRERVPLPNLLPPIRLDAEADWPAIKADAILCINMAHISPWTATIGLLRGASDVLLAGGLLYLYGPYRRAGVVTAASNEAFDASLKARDPRWGLREVETVEAEAMKRGFRLHRTAEMPANNPSSPMTTIIPPNPPHQRT